jgi:hypothetical protein
MDNKALELQIQKILEMSQRDFERELVGAVSRDEDFLKGLRLPATSPGQPVSQLFASLPWPERLKRVEFALGEAWQKNKDRLYELVCVKFEYCAQKAAGELRLLCGLVSVLMGKGIIFAAYPKLWPIPLVIVYLYKNGFFDKLCKCDERK